MQDMQSDENNFYFEYILPLKQNTYLLEYTIFSKTNFSYVKIEDKLKKILKNKNVYLTFDVDSFDSGIMPATGTPEPGGLFWYETLNLLKYIFKSSNVVGADINELAPIKGFESYNFLVAKLVYKILSYKFLFR